MERSGLTSNLETSQTKPVIPNRNILQITNVILIF